MMKDFWGFLLQTLTVSGAAAMLLLVKAIFRDKLSPRWQFAIWGLLGMVMLVPAGFGGHYVLVNWPFVVELLKGMVGGPYTVTQIIAPVPLLSWKQPQGILEWLFLLYVIGIAVLLLWDLIAYVRLRTALRRGKSISAEQAALLSQTASKYGLSACRAVEVDGISSAFVCGLFRPVLALPAGTLTDEKVLLHELLHVHHHDVFWGILIHLFRCLHWCNPFLWYCARLAANDLESLCDQRVLERLEGEERRDYGRILLSMTNEKYASMLGTSSVANGGSCIRARIEAIARFKRYPRGMALASVCVAIVLAVPLLTGAEAADIKTYHNPVLSLASARATRCSTLAGALDTYGKAILSKNGIYRIACAPLAEQKELQTQLEAVRDVHFWNGGLERFALTQYGYELYNLVATGENSWECLVVVTVEENEAPPAPPVVLAAQSVRAYEENGRWVVEPQEPFWFVETDAGRHNWGCEELPAFLYEDETETFRVSTLLQYNAVVNNDLQTENFSTWLGKSTVRFDMRPKPHAEFEAFKYSESMYVRYLGDAADRKQVKTLRLSTKHWKQGTERPELEYGDENEWYSMSSSSSEIIGSQSIPDDWNGHSEISGGGSEWTDLAEMPDAIAADLYVNGELHGQLTLTRKGMAEHG